MANREKLEALVTGSGMLSGALGIAAALARRALGPLALPMAVGGGLMWLGRSMGDAFVEVTDSTVRMKLGVLFDETIPLSEISQVRKSSWKLIGGLGVRTNFRDMVAVVTAPGEIAELSLWRPRPTPVIPRIWYVRALRILVSPESLESFIEDLSSRLQS